MRISIDMNHPSNICLWVRSCCQWFHGTQVGECMSLAEHVIPPFTPIHTPMTGCRRGACVLRQLLCCTSHEWGLWIDLLLVEIQDLDQNKVHCFKSQEQYFFDLFITPRWEKEVKCKCCFVDFLFPLVVSFEEQRVVPVGAGRVAACRHSGTHPQPGGEQLRGGRAPDLVLPAQHPLPRRLPRRVPQVLQRAERLWRRGGARPAFQRLPSLCSLQGGGPPGAVAGVSHASFHAGLLPTAALPQPDRGAVGSSPWRGTLAEQVGLTIHLTRENA